MPCALRDDGEYLMGLPRLSEKDQARVEAGNADLAFICTVIDECVKAKVMCVVENPITSRLWATPQMQQRLAVAAGVHTVDYCAFGEQWRKRTRLAAWCKPLRNVPELCASKRGVCSFTGRQHVLLTGVNEKGAFRTAVASPYPGRMCR